MCDTCGCGQPDNAVTILKPGQKPETGHHDDHHSHDHDSHTHDHSHGHSHTISVEEDILGQNNRLAERNRGYFDAKGITALNLVSSPGSGKTTLLEKTIHSLRDSLDMFVIEGDQQTLRDADRIDATGVPVVQVNTGTGCHLDAVMVRRAVNELSPADQSLLFIENVGNLVCPALFDLGEAHRVVIVSVTEGDDKPYKYPNMFDHSDVCIINKIDLLPYVEFDLDTCKDYAKRINPELTFFELSATRGDGMDAWITWLQNHIQKTT